MLCFNMIVRAQLSVPVLARGERPHACVSVLWPVFRVYPVAGLLPRGALSDWHLPTVLPQGSAGRWAPEVGASR